MSHVKSPDQVQGIRLACQLVSSALAALKPYIRNGAATNTLDEVAEAHIRGKGGVPAFKGYRGFPASVCVSVNHEVVHGIPGSRRLKTGDIVSVDCGVNLNGYFGDAAYTFTVGKVTPALTRLLQVTRESLYHGIAQARAGNQVHRIGAAVQALAEANSLSVIRELSGHGVGLALHEDLQVPNYHDPAATTVLEPGMVIAIEPMLNLGRPEIKVGHDRWTISAADRRHSAHFEHTVLVTDGEPEVLTSHPE